MFFQLGTTLHLLEGLIEFLQSIKFVATSHKLLITNFKPNLIINEAFLEEKKQSTKDEVKLIEVLSSPSKFIMGF